ncbi:MAG: PspA/IM30 family protein [Thermomicrobiales bacterium]
MDRLSTLIRANVNDLLDRAEDPEKMLDQILRDMQSNITTARAQVASMIAQEKELEADHDETQRLALEWGTKAKRAVDASKDDLAREALRRKRDNDENSRVYSQQLTIQKQAVTKLKDQLRQLEAKYQSTLSQRDTLLARQRRAKAQARVAETLTSFSPMDPTADLERMERKIRSGEAKAAAMIEMGDESFDTRFAELDYDIDIEAELAALKGEPLPAGALSEGSSEPTEETTVGQSTQPN